MSNLVGCTMKYIFLFLTLFFAPCLAEEKETMPESYRVWEQQNASREVKEEGRYGELWNKTLFLLIVILAVLFIATWFLKRFDRFKLKPSDKTTRIQLIERKVLSPKSVLYLIEIDGNKIALSESATNGVQVLSLLPPEQKTTQ